MGGLFSQIEILAAVISKYRYKFRLSSVYPLRTITLSAEFRIINANGCQTFVFLSVITIQIRMSCI